MGYTQKKRSSAIQIQIEFQQSRKLTIFIIYLHTYITRWWQYNMKLCRGTKKIYLKSEKDFLPENLCEHFCWRCTYLCCSFGGTNNFLYTFLHVHGTPKTHSKPLMYLNVYVASSRLILWRLLCERSTKLLWVKNVYIKVSIVSH